VGGAARRGSDHGPEALSLRRAEPDRLVDVAQRAQAQLGGGDARRERRVQALGVGHAAAAGGGTRQLGERAMRQARGERLGALFEEREPRAPRGGRSQHGVDLVGPQRLAQRRGAQAGARLFALGRAQRPHHERARREVGGLAEQRDELVDPSGRALGAEHREREGREIGVERRRLAPAEARELVLGPLRQRGARLRLTQREGGEREQRERAPAGLGRAGQLGRHHVAQLAGEGPRHLARERERHGVVAHQARGVVDELERHEGHVGLGGGRELSRELEGVRERERALGHLGPQPAREREPLFGRERAMVPREREVGGALEREARVARAPRVGVHPGRAARDASLELGLAPRHHARGRERVASGVAHAHGQLVARLGGRGARAEGREP
jgi:hypothetical protein